MSDVFGISVSALQAFQTAMSVTSNNIANANTPGYVDESVDLTNAVAQSAAQAPIGNGVAVLSINRTFSQATENQLNTSQSGLGQLNSLKSYTDQINNIIGTTAGGLSTALQSYYGAWSGVANDPTSSAARQALLSKAQGVASSFQATSSQLQALNTDVNTRITSDVQQINSYAQSIATLNQQIVVGTAQGGGQAPNDLLDQRDQAVSNLSKLVGISTTTDANGAVSVFVGSGQPLVLSNVAYSLTTVSNQFNGTQLGIATGSNPKDDISSSITSGDLGGLIAARTQAIDPAINQLGQLATALSSAANAQQASGLDLNGKFGSPLFSVGAPVVTASTANTDATSATVGVANVGALTANDYLLSYKGNAYSLTNQETGAAVAFTANGNTLSADGLTITLSGTPANGDQFLIQPTAQAAGTFTVALANTSQIAAAGAIATTASGTNTGNATISAGTVTNPAAVNLAASTTIQFTSPTSYTINGGAATPYTAGGNIAFGGWQVQISGTPAAGESFTVAGNTAGTGDNRNALASAAGENSGVLANGTVSVSSGTGALITGIGSQSAQVNTAQAAQSAVNTQALQNLQSLSGVSLDQEAANLLQWQQAYQASAQALSIANSLFTTLIDSVNGSST